MDYQYELTQACRRLEDLIKDDDTTVPSLTRKGRTLYIVSPEARELRRLDRVYSGIESC